MKYQLKGKYFDGIVHPRKAHTILTGFVTIQNRPQTMNLITIEKHDQPFRRQIFAAILLILASVLFWTWLIWQLTTLNSL